MLERRKMLARMAMRRFLSDLPDDLVDEALKVAERIIAMRKGRR